MTIMNKEVMFVGFGWNGHLKDTGYTAHLATHEYINIVMIAGWIYHKSNDSWSAEITFAHMRHKPICGTYTDAGSGVIKVIVAGGGLAETNEVEVLISDNWMQPQSMDKLYQQLFVGRSFVRGEIPT